MKFITLLKQILLEDKGKHDYGCVMLYVDDFTKKMNEIHSLIDKDDIYNGQEGDDRSYGLEKDPHVTILYGLHDTVSLEDINEQLNDSSFSTLSIKDVSLFGNDYDVLKFDIGDAKPLIFYNKKLSKLPNSNTFPNYIPHMTIGYLKKGKGQKYVDLIKEKYKEWEGIVPSHIVYSEANGKQNKIKINID